MHVRAARYEVDRQRQSVERGEETREMRIAGEVARGDEAEQFAVERLGKP